MSPRKRLITSVVIIFGVYVVGTAGYAVIAGRSLFDAAYMAAITISTVGYGEVFELDRAGRIWTIIFIVFGVAGASYALTSLASMFVSGDIADMFGRRKLEAAVRQLKGHVILCGYGRMGALTVGQLKQRQLSIVVVEQDAAVCEQLRAENIPFIQGDATDDDTLAEAGLDKAEALVAALPHDADNVYITLTAHGMRPDMTIIARAELPSTEPKLKRAGATRVICPQVVGATKVANILSRPNVVDLMEVAAAGIDLEMEEYVVGAKSPLCDITLRDSPIRKAADAIVVAIKHAEGMTLYHPSPEETIRAGDILILIGKAGVSDRLRDIAPSSGR